MCSASCANSLMHSSNVACRVTLFVLSDTFVVILWVSNSHALKSCTCLAGLAQCQLCSLPCPPVTACLSDTAKHICRVSQQHLQIKGCRVQRPTCQTQIQQAYQPSAGAPFASHVLGCPRHLLAGLLVSGCVRSPPILSVIGCQLHILLHVGSQSGHLAVLQLLEARCIC